LGNKTAVLTEPSLAGEGILGTRHEINSHVENRFHDISPSEQEELKSAVEFLAGKNYPLGDLWTPLSQYRPTEGKAYLSFVKRVRSLIVADKQDIQGVHVPLDVFVNPSGKKIEIFIPENLDSYADSGIIHDLFRYFTSVEGVKLTRTAGQMASSDKEGDFFIMGYITEILSDQKIEKISFAKGAAYQLGRMCARTKTLLSVINQHKVPTKFLKIPERYLGGTQQFREPEITRALQTYFKSDQAIHLRHFLESLLEHSIRVNRGKAEGKIGKGVFLPASETLHVFKRKTRRVVQTSKRGGKTTVVEVIDPTKPSQLATIAPWEREAISEIYEYPWETLKKLADEFEETLPMDRDYERFGKKISEMFTLQWQSKQYLLRATKHRLEGYTGDRSDPLFKKLNFVREYLSQYATLEMLPASVRQDFSPYQILPSRISKGKELEATPPDVLYKDKRMATLFPHADRLLSAWEKLLPPPVVDFSFPGVSMPER
jgi:hypothetical protein